MAIMTGVEFFSKVQSMQNWGQKWVLPGMTFREDG
jgi:hypothetical protein